MSLAVRVFTRISISFNRVLVDELQESEQQHATKSIGGVLDGIFMTPVTTIIEQHIDITNDATCGIGLGLPEPPPPNANILILNNYFFLGM